MRRAISKAFTPRAVARLGDDFQAKSTPSWTRHPARARRPGRRDRPPAVGPAGRGVHRGAAEDEEQVKHGLLVFQLFLSPQPPARQLELARTS